MQREEEIKKILIRALKEEKRLEIIYESGGVFTQRKIKIIDLEDSTATAYCYLRKQKRTFKIKQILSAQIVF